MAIFKSSEKSKQVMVAGVIVKFENGHLETTDEAVIEALKGARNVTEAKTGSAEKTASKTAK